MQDIFYLQAVVRVCGSRLRQGVADPNRRSGARCGGDAVPEPPELKALSTNVGSLLPMLEAAL
jgi:hypothetical protein